MKKLFLIVVSLLQLILCGCTPYFRYGGEHIDLAAAAIYSLPGVDSESDDQILVLDTDKYGRVLYSVCFTGNHIVEKSHEECVLAILVMQKSNDTHVWFYGEKNYCMILIDERVELTKDVVNDYFSLEVVDELKAANDWNNEYNEEAENMVKTENRVDKAVRISDTVKKQLEEKIGDNIRPVYLRDDANGNAVYFILDIQKNDGGSRYSWYAAKIKDDKVVDDAIIKISGSDTIAKELHEFIW